MCLFGSRSESPPTLESVSSTESYEQQETISGVDMMIRHFRSQSFRDYQSRTPPSRSPSRSPYHTPSPSTQHRLHSIIIDPSTSTPVSIIVDPCISFVPSTTTFVPSTSTIVSSTPPIPPASIKPYSVQQRNLFHNLITDT